MYFSSFFFHLNSLNILKILKFYLNITLKFAFFYLKKKEKKKHIKPSHSLNRSLLFSSITTYEAVIKIKKYV